MRTSHLLTGVLLLLMIAAMAAAQTALSNEDLVKLVKAGLSEEFILNLVQQQTTALVTDAGRLVDLKNNGASERIILAAARRTPPVEPITTSGLTQLVQTGFSEGFLMDLVTIHPVRISMDAANIVQLKQAGVSERLLSALIGRGANGRELAKGAEIVVRLIDGIDSEKSKEGDTFRASLDEPLMIEGETLAPKGADATVKLVAAQESGKLTGRTELTVALVSVAVGGRRLEVNTSTVSQASGSRGERTAKVAVGTAAVGAIIGAIAGGGQGAAIGAGAGAAAGAGSQVFMKGQRVNIPSETILTFTTDAPVKLP
jgi:hypothetical protein